ncbi:hypothetical protein B0T10DRAFT_579378 [Thelonectria olida]|uniref:WW domain-containing protein n=1 Tax=Thelonectria olida TaxID=1576542 RepID=A0A9P8VNS5_9HYPO|nr:hypothetical protein B0T10DRAFT_579378 [Thelonectria olida]
MPIRRRPAPGAASVPGQQTQPQGFAPQTYATANISTNAPPLAPAHSSPATTNDRIGPLTPATTVSTPSTIASPAWQAPRINNTGGLPLQTCNCCKQGIPPNVAVYACLVCNTAHILTIFCASCMTNSPTNSHEHEKSYFAADSDQLMQVTDAAIPAHLWTVRKNFTGRIWYMHTPTRLKTHIKPTVIPQAASGLLPGWEEGKAPDGRPFFFNRGTGASVWEKPVKPITPLPTGWKEVRTPESVPLYFNEGLGLSTWEHPGVQSTHRAVSADNPAASMAVAKTKSSGVDMSSAGLMSATKAATKYTTQGFKTASKKMGKFGTKSNLKKMGLLVGGAALLVGGGELVGEIADLGDIGGDFGGDFGGGDFGDGGGESAGDSQAYEQPAYEQPACEQQAYEQPAYEQPAYEQPVEEQPAFEQQPVEVQPVFEPPVEEQAVTDQPVSDPPASDPPVQEQPVYEQPVLDQAAFEQSAAEQVEAQQAVAEEAIAEQQAAIVEQQAVIEQQAVMQQGVMEQALADQSIFQQQAAESSFAMVAGVPYYDSSNARDYI